jgi:phenylalanyl-tRNA synthetase beta chain
MKISYNWLKDYISIDIPPEKVAELLTGCGLEVEGMSKWQSVKGGLEGIVIGEVLTCVKHPNSDHLSLTTVTIGTGDPLKIVCGASNVAAGQKVAVATIGTKLTPGDREITIQRSKIRGEISEGMICAEDELGLGTSHAGIMVLDPAAVPGTSGKEYFGLVEDDVFEIGLTPNRTDAVSHSGVARDLAAVLNNFGKNSAGEGARFEMKLPSTSGYGRDTQGRSVRVTVEDPKACPRYSGVTLAGVTVAESPEWLKNRLLAIGMRPINNIVDATNYVMMELGQPLHAFDADRIAGDHVVVKKYPAGTRFVTLDEVERKLSADDLMICSESEPMCIAGVFGGIGSGVTADTKNIFIESAYFDPKTVRKTSKYHALQTDSSFRFERGANFGITTYALERAALLIKELAGGEVSSDIVDVCSGPEVKPEVRMSWEHLHRLAGKVIAHDVAEAILTDLGMVTVDKDATGITLSVPGFKADVTREADLIEEVLRIYGYNNIEIPSEVRSSLNISHKPDREVLRSLVAEYLSSAGFFEVMNNSLTPSAWYEGEGTFGPEKLVKIINPLSRELEAMRQTLLFGGLETIVYNQHRKTSDMKLFEFGTVYSLAADKNSNDPLPGFHEETRLALFMTGHKEEENWNVTSAETDFFELKGHVNALFKRLNIPAGALTATPYSSDHIAAGLSFEADGSVVAVTGIVSRATLKQFDCKEAVLYADFRWDMLAKLAAGNQISFRDLPRFPEVRRDLALLVDSAVTFSQIEQIACQTEKKLLRKVGLFDVYEGDKIGAGKKSYAVSFILLDEEKTLTDGEIDKVMQKLITAYEKQAGAVIR